jgi:hypothetical protein
MLKVYVNYPNTRVSVHRSLSRQQIEKMAKPFQRVVRSNAESISTELRRFSDGIIPSQPNGA